MNLVPPKEEKKPVTWELIHQSKMSDTVRMKVPGGWLYRHKEVTVMSGINEPAGMAMSMCFVPDTGIKLDLFNQQVLAEVES